MKFYRLLPILAAMAIASCSGSREKTAESDPTVEDATTTQFTQSETTNQQVEEQQTEAPADNTITEEMATETTPLPAETPAVSGGDVKVKVETDKGDFTIVLFGDTPKHRDNFVKLVNEGYYNGTLFHRVINDFMVQAGDPDSKNAPAGKMLGSGGPNYTVEAEIVYPRHFHRRGALAAARQGDQVNPERRSSGSQFYVVTGQVYKPEQLTQFERQMQMMAEQAAFDRLAQANRDSIMAMRRNRDQAGLGALQEKLIAEAKAEAAKAPVKMTPEMIEAYTTVGGTPHLDGQYTVFGEVVDGMEVIDAIEKVETDRNDRPVADVKIKKMTVVK